MTAPKNDKARKAWLAGLKDGDEVAIVNERGDCHLVKIHRRSFAFHCAGREFTLRGGKRIKRERYDNTPTYLMPITEEMRRRKYVEGLRERLIAACRSSGMREFTDAKILAVSAILWPEVKP